MVPSDDASLDVLVRRGRIVSPKLRDEHLLREIAEIERDAEALLGGLDGHAPAYVQTAGPALCPDAYAACSADTHCAGNLTAIGCYSEVGDCPWWASNLWESYLGCVTCVAPCFESVCAPLSGPCAVGAGGGVAQGCQTNAACLPGPGCGRNSLVGDCHWACYCTKADVYGCANQCSSGGGSSGPLCSPNGFCANGTFCEAPSDKGSGCVRHCQCSSSKLSCTDTCTAGGGGGGSGGG